MRDAFVESLFELACSDPNVMLLTGDLGFGVFEQFEIDHPLQYINVGVAEQNMTGVAAGLSLEGKKVLTYSIGNFPTLRCLEQIRNDACYHDANVTVVATGGGFSYGALGMSHHCTEDLSILRALPNVTVIAPSTRWEARQATKEIVNRSGVGYLRIDKTVANDDNGSIGGSFQIGKARTLHQGNDLTIISTGGITAEAMKAVEIAENDGFSIRLLSMHTIKPIDENAILLAAKETKNIITVEENTIIGGLGSAVAEVCMTAGVNLESFKRIGLQDTYSSVVGSQQYLREHYEMDSQAIYSNIISCLK